VNDKILE